MWPNTMGMETSHVQIGILTVQILYGKMLILKESARDKTSIALAYMHRTLKTYYELDSDGSSIRSNAEYLIICTT